MSVSKQTLIIGLGDLNIYGLLFRNVGVNNTYILTIGTQQKFENASE